MDFLLDLSYINARHSIGAVEDACDLLERRALGLDVEEVDEDELEEVPELQQSKQSHVSQSVDLSVGQPLRERGNSLYRTA